MRVRSFSKCTSMPGPLRPPWPPRFTCRGLQALQVARKRGLPSLELRNGITLARLWADRGEANRALELLDPILNRFSEEFQTRDPCEKGNPCTPLLEIFLAEGWRERWWQ
jgi:hypothetical protein